MITEHCRKYSIGSFHCSFVQLFMMMMISVISLMHAYMNSKNLTLRECTNFKLLCENEKRFFHIYYFVCFFVFFFSFANQSEIVVKCQFHSFISKALLLFCQFERHDVCVSIITKGIKFILRDFSSFYQLGFLYLCSM
jgi:hypothetical protein